MNIEEQLARLQPAEQQLTLALNAYFKALCDERDTMLISRLKKRFASPEVVKKMTELLRGQ
jgi:hypothetical protein